MSLQLHRPDGEGGLEPRPVAEPDWRTQEMLLWEGGDEGTLDTRPEDEDPLRDALAAFNQVGDR